MNRPDRMDERLAALLTELAAPRVPDYLDDMLRRTAATRQLPAWRSLERWIPMGVLTRPAPLGVPAWQPLLLLVGVLLAIAATVLIAGAQPRVPPPFGLHGTATSW